MSLVTPFVEARKLLGLDAESDAAAIKRAYRREVMAHPPDTDPAQFRRVRDAYELLSDPGSRTRDMLLSPVPTVAPPELPPLPPPPPCGATALALLRVVVMGLDTSELEPKPAKKSSR